MPIPTIAIEARQSGEQLCIQLTIGEDRLSVTGVLTDLSSSRFRVDRVEVAHMLRDLASSLEQGRS